jgi:hypothetical protein
MSAPVGRVISAQFSASGFAKRWNHCHQLANYLARFASSDEDDPARHSTLLSTFFNELLEAIYRNHSSSGHITIEFERNDGRIRLRAEVPVNEESIAFYRNADQLVNQPDPMGWYRERLEHDAPEEEITVLGMLELAVVYDCKISVAEQADGDTLSLLIDLPVTEVDEP